MDTQWTWSIPSEADGPEVEVVRAEIREALVESHADDVGGAELLVWELMINALFHTDDGARVCVRDDVEKVRIEVSDGGENDLELRSADPTRVGGHGLELVEALSQSWGVIDRTGGKTVWFEGGGLRR